ncbi:TOPRIM nucleotidyl transferase/hydrolase domain-containing protein [Micromonospora mirobrigensis]|uniref:OLD protein-like TOPRIM domain-containing protein n=1 Tax=Micromonospora mirobrigensis TaxID=262898 RepID=A0A1C4YVF5_9ACTN|nr:TOPRIM nucleotidyl transferase/hydrolase domain-containing protein [Micromonospora mirobrigensis]SCF24654.1 hypothetical protein GA0070564_104427 [Micromonospora mirobrigensis]
MATIGRADLPPRGSAPDAVDGPLGGNGASLRATAQALAEAGTAAAVVLVEGISDRIALATAAAGRGRDLSAERVVIVPMGGAHPVGRFLTMLGPQGAGRRLAGLCDLREEGIFRRGLDLARIWSPHTRDELERLGFAVCVGDLEEELIRALGVAGVEALLESQGDLRSFRAFQSQPAWRGREPGTQLWRFLRSSSRRSLRYVRLLTEVAAERETLPRPLETVLAAV